jgi:antitoxin PrlF
MQTYYGTLTSDGQLTVPREVRERLRLKANDKVAFTVDEESVRIESADSDLESLIGSLPALPGASADFEREIEMATEDAYEKTIRQLRGERS